MGVEWLGMVTPEISGVGTWNSPRKTSAEFLRSFAFVWKNKELTHHSGCPCKLHCLGRDSKHIKSQLDIDGQMFDTWIE